MWKSIKQLTASILGWMSISVLCVLVITVLWGVFTRKVLGDQVRWSEELARFLLVWVCFLGGAIAYLDEKHLGVDLLVTNFEKSAQRLAKLITHLLVFLFSLLAMGIGGTQLVMDRFDSGQILPALQVNKAWIYLAVPCSGYLIALFAAGNVLALMAGQELTPSEEEVHCE